MSTPVKQIDNESTHTSGGIRKSLLTPIRRIGLSRTRKTPMSIERLLTSPIISPSPGSDNLNTTPVARRSVKPRERNIKKLDNINHDDLVINENQKIQNSFKPVDVNEDKLVKEATEEITNELKLVDEIRINNCNVILEKTDLCIEKIEDKNKKRNKATKNKKRKDKVLPKTKKGNSVFKDDIENIEEKSQSDIAEQLELNNIVKPELINVSQPDIHNIQNEIENVNIIEDNVNPLILPITNENCDNLKKSKSEYKDLIDDKKEIIPLQQKNVKDRKSTKNNKSTDKRNVKNKSDSSKKNPRRKIISVLDSSSDEEKYFTDANAISSPCVKSKELTSFENYKLKDLVKEKNEFVESQPSIKGNSIPKLNKIVIDSNSDENTSDKKQTKLEKNVSTNSKFSRKRLSLKSSTSTIVLSDSDDDFIVKPKIPRVLSSSTNSSQTNSFSIQKPLSEVSIEHLLLDVKELDERLTKKERILEELKQAKIYKKKHNLNDLKALSNVWKHGCQNAMLDLLEKLKGNEIITNMGLLLKNLNVPEHLIKYDPENDCFI